MTKRGQRFKWRIVGTFAGLLALAGVMIAGVLYVITERILNEQSHERATLITLNLADAAAGHVLGKDLLQLDALVTKYERLDHVAYAFIENRAGDVIASSSGNFSPELQQPLTIDQRREMGRRGVELRGRPVYETRAPILEGQLGTAHVGIWAEPVQQAIYRALLLQISGLAAVLLLTIFLAMLIARRLVQPFRRLADIADRVSTGDLDTPIRTASKDEFGELTLSLERMRASLKAAKLRLNRV